MTALPAASGWHARLELGFAPHHGRTVLARRRHVGPLTVQRPFHPGDGACHVYLLHPPGGVVAGDRLELDVDVAAGAHALLTTPGAAKFYRSLQHFAAQHQTLRVAPGAALEWLPQETIVFDGALAHLHTRVQLAARARFIGWELLCLGRPAAAERFASGQVRQHFELWQGDRPLLLERSDLRGGDAVLQAPWGLRGCAVAGTLVAAPAGPDELAAVRAVIEGNALTLGATLHDEVLVLRGLSEATETLRAAFVRAWAALRPSLVGVQAVAPRIWAT